MANYSNLKAAIAAAIKTNGNQEITGQVLQDVLTSVVSVIGANYTFAGVATPATNPGTPDQNVVYMASKAGTYTNFNGIVLPAGISLLMWNGAWTSETVMCGDGGVFDISVYKSSGGTLAKYTDLAAALGTNGANIPQSLRKGGMSVKFVQSSDNKYVQYRLMADDWSVDTDDWSFCGNDVLVENPEWIEVLVDKERKILEGIDIEGKKRIYLEVLFNDAKGESVDVTQLKMSDIITEVVKNESYLDVVTDNSKRVIEAITAEGEKIVFSDMQVVGNFKNKGIGEMDIRNRANKLVFKNDSGRELMSIHANGVVRIDGLCIPSPDGKIYNVIVNHKNGKPCLELVELCRYEKIYNEQN